MQVHRFKSENRKLVHQELIHNEYHTIARRCDVIPMSVNSVDGKVSVIYFDATVTMNGKEFTSRKIIPTNTLKKMKKEIVFLQKLLLNQV